MSHTTSVMKLRTHPTAPFDLLTHGLSGPARTRITALLHRNARRYTAGSDIVREGDNTVPFFWVLDGWVALNKSLEDGHVQTIDIILPSDVITPAAWERSISTFDVHALTDITVSALPLTDLDSLELADPPHVWASIRNLSAAARARIAERVLRLGQGSAEMRVAYVLTELYLRISALDDDQNMNFHLPLTQQQIGEFAGLSSVHVCRTLRRLSRGGLIDTNDHLNITIKDLDGLVSIAGIELNRLKAEILPSETQA